MNHVPPSNELMEPEASRPTTDKSTKAERSIAISLKRIADMMERASKELSNGE